MRYQIDIVKEHWLKCQIPMKKCKICELANQSLQLLLKEKYGEEE